VRCLILESHHLASIDSSGLSAIEALRRDLERRGVRLIVCGLHRQPLTELKTATNTQKSSVLLISDLRSALSVADAQLRYQQVNKTVEDLPKQQARLPHRPAK
ncbi:MAG: sodium-independent anion transporter, partial [Burkholderiales bacterium]|nr:sodium-independent anion transporter [Burkholderiales bacterium]